MPEPHTRPRKLMLHERVIRLLEEIDRADGYTCEDIARLLSARSYAGDQAVDARSINAAMSGISQRVRTRRYVTDGQESAKSQSWKRRRWRLAPDGYAKAKAIREDTTTE